MIEIGTISNLRDVTAEFPSPEINLAENLTAITALSRAVFRRGVDLLPSGRDLIPEHYRYFTEDYLEISGRQIPEDFAIGHSLSKAYDGFSGLPVSARASFIGEIGSGIPPATDGIRKLGIVDIGAEIPNDSDSSTAIAYRFSPEGYADVSGYMTYSHPSRINRISKSGFLLQVMLHALDLNTVLPTALQSPDTYLLFSEVPIAADHIERLLDSQLVGFNR